jgi:hypothetical protein
MLGLASLPEVLTAGPRLTGVPNVKSALTIFVAGVVNNANTTQIVFLFQNMIHTSILVLLLGLLYYDMSLGSGAQTIRPGWVGPVSYLYGDDTLTGCFLLSTVRTTESLYSPSTLQNLCFMLFQPSFPLLLSTGCPS